MSTPQQPTFSHLSVAAPDNPTVEMVGLRAEMKLWFDRPFNEFASQFLDAFDWLSARLKGQLKWYQNYTMNRFSPLTSNTLGAPHTWLRSGRQDVARMLYLKGPDALRAAGQYVLDFKYHPDEALYADANTPFLKVATPAELLEQNPEGFLRTAQQFCDLLPYLCGHVGYSFETSPYYENQAYRAVYPLAMRHPGATIASDHATWPLRDDKGIESVNWLTLVGRIPLAKLGGAAALRSAVSGSPQVKLHDTVHGVILQAGVSAQIGDVNRGERLPVYRDVYRALRPVIEPINADFGPLLLGGVLEEDAEKTQRWLRRFEL